MSVAVATVRLMIIDCDTCTAGPAACADCVVSFLTVPIGPARGVVGTVDLDAGEQRAIGVLAASGLVPPLRLERIG